MYSGELHGIKQTQWRILHGYAAYRCSEAHKQTACVEHYLECITADSGDHGLVAVARSNDGKWAAPTCKPPTADGLLERYKDLGGFNYPILTTSPTAQRLFDVVRWPLLLVFLLDEVLLFHRNDQGIKSTTF